MTVYKNYNQEALNLQYNNRYHVPDFETHLQLWQRLSLQTEKELNIVKDISYGPSKRECLDIVPSAKSNSKVLVFIHGGYWQKFDKSNFHFIAKTFYSYEITTVIINYPLSPVATMNEIVSSCHAALTWVHNNIKTYNGDANNIFIAGHSAGAHLAAMLLLKENTEMNFIKGICGFSGLYNLMPIQHSNINDGLGMNSEMASKNSPALNEPTTICPIVLACGSDETDEFIDQSKELQKNWQQKINSIKFIEIPGLNHFSILSAIIDTKGMLHQSICKLMRI